MPTDGAGGRVYPDEALDLMQEARELLKTRRVGTIEQAFRLLADDHEGAELALQQADTPALLQELVSEMKPMRQMIERLSEDNAALREQLQALPPAREEKPRRRGLLGWFKRTGN